MINKDVDNEKLRKFLKGTTYLRVEATQFNHFLEEIKVYFELFEDSQLTDLQKTKKQVLQQRVDSICRYQFLEEKHNNLLINYIIQSEKTLNPYREQAYNQYVLAKEELVNFKENNDLLIFS